MNGPNDVNDINEPNDPNDPNVNNVFVAYTHQRVKALTKHRHTCVIADNGV